MTRTIMVLALAAVGGGVQTASAQRYDLPQPKPFYFSGGLGGGSFTPKCDTGCFGDRRSASGIALFAGWALSPRLRVEVAWQVLAAADGERGHVITLSAGVAAYPIGRFFVRAGVGQLDLSTEDSTGGAEGKTVPGFTVGAGYDLFLSRKFAITPYVNVLAGSLNELAYFGGGGTGTTAGSVIAVSAGVSFTYRGRNRNWK
jgi:hypothetical protein